MKKALKIIGKTILYSIGILLLAFIILYFSNKGDYQVANTIEHDTSIPYIEFDDVSLHIQTFGSEENPVVIVLHGGPGNDSRYLLPLQEMADSFYVVFYDQRGCGLSPRVSAEELTLESYLLDLDNIVSHYGRGEKVNIIGHSWGAMLASAYLGSHPEKVNKAVLAEPGFLNNKMYKRFNVVTNNMNVNLTFSVIRHMIKNYFRSLHVKGPDAQAKMDYFLINFILTEDIDNHPMAGYFCDGKIKPETLQYWRFGSLASRVLQQKALDDDGNMIINFVEGIDNFDGEVMLMAGECNKLIGESHQRQHFKLFPKARLAIISDAGHNMLTEQPTVCIPIMTSFFNEVTEENIND